MDRRLAARGARTETRDGVRTLRAGFPAEDRRAFHSARAYPAKFIQALTDADFLAAPSPEAHRGARLGLRNAAGVVEPIGEQTCSGEVCHAPMKSHNLYEIFFDLVRFSADSLLNPSKHVLGFPRSY